MAAQQKYTEETIETAIELLMSKRMSLNGALRGYSTPYSLGDKVRG